MTILQKYNPIPNKMSITIFTQIEKVPSENVYGNNLKNEQCFKNNHFRAQKIMHM